MNGRLRRAAVVGSCQAVGIAASLRRLHPDARIEAFHVGAMSDPGKAERACHGADLVVTQVGDGGCEPNRFAPARLRKTARRVVSLPVIAFPGFHPDIVLLPKAIPRERGYDLGQYASVIAAAAHALGFDPRRAERLYNAHTYEVLGFADYYATTKRNFLVLMRAAGLDLAPHFDAWMRTGPFMHTINHPAVRVLDTATRVALGAAPDDGPAGKAAPLEDRLARSVVLPVYPEFACRIGVTGSTTVQRAVLGVANPDLSSRAVSLRQVVVQTYRLLDDWPRMLAGNARLERTIDALAAMCGARGRLSGACGTDADRGSMPRADGRAPASPARSRSNGGPELAARHAAAVPSAPSTETTTAASDIEKPIVLPQFRVSARHDAPKRVAIVGSCQVGGIAQAVRAMYPGVEAQPYHVALLKDHAPAIAACEAADLVLTQLSGMGPYGFKKFCENKRRVIMLPPIVFPGLHPDIITTPNQHKPKAGDITGRFYSLIAVAAFQLGFEPRRAVRLINSYTFRLLEFENYFLESKRAMLTVFARAGLDIRDLFDEWCRSGQFMHTSVHPALRVIESLVRRAFRVAFGTIPDRRLPADAEDGLERLMTWAMYPEFSRAIGVEGCPLFRHGTRNGRASEENRSFSTLAFVESNYRRLEAEPDSFDGNVRILNAIEKLRGACVAA